MNFKLVLSLENSETANTAELELTDATWKDIEKEAESYVAVTLKDWRKPNLSTRT